MTFWDFVSNPPWFTFGSLLVVCITVASVAEDLSKIGRK